MKYVIRKLTLAGVERYYHVIFPEMICHSSIDEGLQRALYCDFKDPGEKFSAGFCHFYKGEWQTEHGSESMNIKKDQRKGFVDYRVLNLPEAMNGMLL